jgi:hypothetical protein
MLLAKMFYLSKKDATLSYNGLQANVMFTLFTLSIIQSKHQNKKNFKTAQRKKFIFSVRIYMDERPVDIYSQVLFLFFSIEKYHC